MMTYPFNVSGKVMNQYTKSLHDLKVRNLEIFKCFLQGKTYAQMSDRYHISRNRISLIIRNFKIIIGHPDEIRAFFLKNEDKHPSWIKKISKMYLK